ncbi:MAG: deoxyribodipyrimidine photo-lyase [Methanobacteriota archaeon]|nr:MAG: deoxyribodipyrimidine photo-lyase [Euryarchaeota archaeon]|tara:strand:- start:5169 stop:6662 length:1494 start_codon:yes stop_codon:yes gene_type:complete
MWFKRDLRISDNDALEKAAKQKNPLICLYNLDEERLDRKDVDGIHIKWELDCLEQLKFELEKLGGKLIFNFGNIVHKLEEINISYGIDTIYSNEETGLKWSWDRDKSVSEWSKKLNVKYIEFPTNGIIRRLKSRDNWKKYRDKRVNHDITPTPIEINSPSDLNSDPIPEIEELGIFARELINRPKPGEKSAFETLFSFLDERGRGYRKGMSSPISAESMCSRLSPYLSVGCITIKQIIYHTKRKQRKVKQDPRSSKNLGFSTSLSSFQSRLAWHCHFIQRLEAEPTLNDIAINPELDKILIKDFDEQKFNAWKNGMTGWPFFDACMRYLKSNGWINFRMRAMIQSIASYTLWLPWRDTGNVLAKLFLDYEPGIHWSQVQMQSGVTGINSVRAYSVIKQSQDQDPNGVFIRRWVHELRHVPDEFIHEPWKMTEVNQKKYNCEIGLDYPLPIINENDSRKLGIAKTYSAKRDPAVKLRSKIVYDIHGSRRKSNFKKIKN